jgi:hypothetical protein
MGRLGAVSGGPAVVLGLSDRLQMVRVDALRHEAEMVEMRPILRNRTDENLEGNAVRESTPTLVVVPAVSSVRDVPGPEPATRGIHSDASPEALREEGVSIGAHLLAFLLSSPRIGLPAARGSGLWAGWVS